jgi:hypothetical protein
MQFTGAGGVGSQLYDPKNEGPCNPPNPTWDPRRCLLLRGSDQGGDLVNDVLEYWFGGFLQVANDGLDGDGNVFDVNGIGDPFVGLSWGFNGIDSANNQDTNSSFIATSGILSTDTFPQFDSWASSRWAKPGGPFDPHTGTKYVYSQLADVSFKQLGRDVAVPAGGGSLKFWTSYDTEENWDFFTVEVQRPDGTWTTLPDANGHTTQNTGDSCPEGWHELHPWLDHYQTNNGDGTCTASGQGGEWNAASGSSGGWQEWSIDLSAFAGQTVKVRLSYISDWSTQQLGVFIDDVTLPDGTTTSFEGGLDGWEILGPPEGSGDNANNWELTDAGGFPVGASISTPKSIVMGYGFEGISGQASRNAVMSRIVDHLLGP